MKKIKLTDEIYARTAKMAASKVVKNQYGYDTRTDGVLTIHERPYLVKNDYSYAIIGNELDFEELDFDGYENVAEDDSAIYYRAYGYMNIERDAYCMGAGPEFYVAVLK